jgi:hypothetical protein
MGGSGRVLKLKSISLADRECSCDVHVLVNCFVVKIGGG